MTRKNAIIIGGSSEIGLETAKKLAKAGYNLILTYNSTKIDTQKLGKDASVKTYHLNLLENGGVESFFEQVSKEFDHLDVLIYVSGLAQKRALILDTQNAEIDNLFEVNIKGAIKCVREFSRLTVNHNSASIVLVGSFVEKFGCSCESAYTASKTALSGLARSLANELGNLDIRINVVAPGFIDTKMNNNLSQDEKDEIADMTPLKRMGTTEDVANAIEFLCGDKASFVTGQTLFVDGGLILE